VSRLVVDTGERVVVGVPTNTHSSARVDIQDEDGRTLLSITIATYTEDDDLVTRAIVEGHAALLLQDASGVQAENSRVLFTRRQS
jgi:hypothetical protein